MYGSAALDSRGLRLVESAGVIEMEESPVEAVRAKPESSLVKAVRAVADGEAEAVVSAGSTGAALAASLLHIRRLPGVHRPAIAVVIPAREGPTVLIDAGANADARPEHLLQFAHMGVVFAEEILGIEDPRVRLLSIGEEDEKGISSRSRRTHSSARARSVSWVTRRAGGCSRGLGRRRDRRVHGQRRAEGARGNDQERARLPTRGARLDHTRQGRWAPHPPGREARARRLDPETYGGAYLLGLRGLVVIAHGSSSRVAIANAIRLAARGVEHDIVKRLEERLTTGVLASARSTNPTADK